MPFAKKRVLGVGSLASWLMEDEATNKTDIFSEHAAGSSCSGAPPIGATTCVPTRRSSSSSWHWRSRPPEVVAAKLLRLPWSVKKIRSTVAPKTGEPSAYRQYAHSHESRLKARSTCPWTEYQCTCNCRSPGTASSMRCTAQYSNKESGRADTNFMLPE